jgi:predicted transcriptional regulator
MTSNSPRTIEDFITTLSFEKNDIIETVRKLTDEGYLSYNINDNKYKRS